MELALTVAFAVAALVLGFVFGLLIGKAERPSAMMDEGRITLIEDRLRVLEAWAEREVQRQLDSHEPMPLVPKPRTRPPV